ncbi:MAG TPA: nuclear transport factor 2 family protein [Dactylosporangium sp.]|jgi:ketosteroid isomerase-like protein|nr:nuclear transport factor 2 family protein [Dactylosporangium sp.]
MTTKSQEIIDRYFEAYAAHDLDAVREVLAEDATWHFPGHHPLSGTKRGPEEIVAFFDRMGGMQLRPDKYVIGATDDYVIEAQRVFSIDDNFAFETETCVLWKFADGRIQSGTHFFADQDKADAFFTARLAAAGRN